VVEQRAAFQGLGADARVSGGHDESAGSDERQPSGVGGAGRDEAVGCTGPGDIAADVLEASATPRLFSSRNSEGSGWLRAPETGGPVEPGDMHANARDTGRMDPGEVPDVDASGDGSDDGGDTRASGAAPAVGSSDSVASGAAGSGAALAGAPALAASRIASARAEAESRSAALSVQIEALAEQQALTTHDDEHDPEGVTIAFERAQLLGLRAGARKEISALDRATSRLRAGNYGRCVNCGNVIPDARLEALPAAETCLNCATTSRSRR
jgi:RNA polymerase-binding transcription factor